LTYKAEKNMRYTEGELRLKLKYYKSLPEKARRHYLGLEYSHLGRGSQRYLAKIFSCSRHTIRSGYQEILSSDTAIFDYKRQRQSGGGRKKKNLS